jgi:uncharacterized protein (TIGR00730 family)
MIQTVAVYCGAHVGYDEYYKTESYKFGGMLVNEGWNLVYGAGGVGLMEQVSAGFIETRDNLPSNVKVTGVITNDLLQIEAVKSGLDVVLYTDTMPARQYRMSKLADVFVLLPGSYGSLFEVTEQISYKILGYHKKPIIILNMSGYWDDFISLHKTMCLDGFYTRDNWPFEVVENADECISLIHKLEGDMHE